MKNAYIFAALAAVLMQTASAETCRKDNEGEQSCQAGTVMICTKDGFSTRDADQRYKWKPLSIAGNPIDAPGGIMPPLGIPQNTPEKCGSDTNSNDRGRNGNQRK